MRQAILQTGTGCDSDRDSSPNASMYFCRSRPTVIRLNSSISFRIAVSNPFSVLMTANLVSMTARSFGTVKSRSRTPTLVAMAKVAGGKDAGNGL